jgi:hypothetical protein
MSDLPNNDINPNEIWNALNLQTGLDFTKSSLKNEMDFVIIKTAYHMEAMITSVFQDQELQANLKTTFEKIINLYPVKKLQNHLTTLTPMYTLKNNAKKICGGGRTRKNKKQKKIYGGEGLLENTMNSFENYIYEDTQQILIDEIKNSINEENIKKSFFNAMYKTSYSIPIIANNDTNIKQLGDKYENLFLSDPSIDDILKQNICSKHKFKNKWKVCTKGGGDVGIKSMIKRYVRNKIIYTLNKIINSTICKQLKRIFGEIFKTTILEEQFMDFLNQIHFKDLCKTKRNITNNMERILKLVRPKYRLSNNDIKKKLNLDDLKKRNELLKLRKQTYDDILTKGTNKITDIDNDKNKNGQIRVDNMNVIENLIDENSESIKSSINSILNTESSTMTRYIHNGLTDYYTSILSNKRMGRLFIQTIEKKVNNMENNIS